MNNKTFDGHISRYYILFILVILSFLIRFLLRSNYLDTWDSVQFALAIKDYSIVLHQPHPSGFPIYIFFGRIVDTFIDNPTKSLIFVSILFGTLSIIPVYLLAEKFFNKETAILSSIIISLNPTHLLFSVVVMTDIVSVFFVATTVYLLYLGVESKRYLYIGSFILGITAGIRPTDIILVSLLIIVLIYRKKLTESMMSIFLVLTGIITWLIPIVYDTGLNTFVKLLYDHWNYGRTVSTLNANGPVVALEYMGHLFIEGWSQALIIFLLTIPILVIIKIKSCDELRNCATDKRSIFIIWWLIIYFIFSISTHTLYIARYILPTFSPLAIIFAYSIIKCTNLTQKKIIKMSLSMLFVVVIISMGMQALASANAVHTTIPAPVNAAEFIKKNFNSQNIIIVANESFRHFQYYLPDFTVKYDDTVSLDEIYNYILENKIVISEELPVVMFTPREFEFIRKDVYLKHERVKIYENELDDKIQLVTLKNYSWFYIEDWNGNLTRWMSSNATLGLYSDNDQNLTIQFQAISFRVPRTLVISSDKDILNRKVIDQKFDTMSTNIVVKKGFNIIQFNVLEGCEKPSHFSNSLDNRCLSIAIQNITILC